MSDELTQLHRAVAELCHEQWSGWMKYLFSKCEILPNGDRGEIAVMPEWAVQRWKRQMETRYEDLSGAEKESDLKEADRFIALLRLGEADTKPLVDPADVAEVSASVGFLDDSETTAAWSRIRQALKTQADKSQGAHTETPKPTQDGG